MSLLKLTRNDTFIVLFIIVDIMILLKLTRNDTFIVLFRGVSLQNFSFSSNAFVPFPSIFLKIIVSF